MRFNVLREYLPFHWFRKTDQFCSNLKFDSSFNALDLLKYLTDSCHYDKHTSPLHGFHEHEIDRISFKLHVYYLKYKPAQNLEFRVQLLIQARWRDPRLSFTNKTTTIDKISGEAEFLNYIWTPHIYLANERSSFIRGKLNKDVAVHILPDGKFKSNDLLLKWENNKAVTISKQASFLPEYKLIETMIFTDEEFSEPDSIETHNYNCSSLRVTFFVARKYGYYMMNYYVPSILLVTVSWVTFWEAPDAIPGRTLLGTGTMLTFIALGVEVSKSLPSVSYIRSSDLWFFGCTIFIFCSLAEFAFVNTLWRYGGQVNLKKATSKYILKSSLGVKSNTKPRRRSLSCPSSSSARWENPLKRVVNNELTVKSLSELEISLPLSELKTMGKETLRISEKIPDPPTTMSMQEIAVWIDKKSRITFPVCFFIFNVVYWSLLVVSQP
ncbi:hypothetical protein PGB90_007018 [Kerria lacca]